MTGALLVATGCPGGTEMRDQVIFMLRGGEVSRYHTIRTLQEDTVGYHSFGVAWFCHFLDPEARKELILAALAHDLAEQHVGDIPAPTKLEFGISESMGAVEDKLLDKAGFLFNLDSQEARVLKLADCFQGMLYCARERSLGNKGVTVVYDRYRSYVLQRLGVHTRGNEMLSIMDDIWKGAQNGEL